MAYAQLTEIERYLSSHLRKQGLCQAEIARQMERYRSTIGREFARNENSKGVYRPSKAQEKPTQDALASEEIHTLPKFTID